MSDFTGTTQEGIFSGNDAVLLNEAISEHLLRQGHVDVADMLIRVGNMIYFTTVELWTQIIAGLLDFYRRKLVRF